MFNQQEVQILLGGVNAPIDFDDLRKNANYGGLYDDDHPTTVAFPSVGLYLNTLILELLTHCASCARSA